MRSFLSFLHYCEHTACLKAAKILPESGMAVPGTGYGVCGARGES